MTTLSLETSKKIYELVGEYETEKSWTKHFRINDALCTAVHIPEGRFNLLKAGYEVTPAPTFSELIRILPKIGEKKGYKMDVFSSGLNTFKLASDLTDMYMDAPTEEEGMEAVEEYLKKLL